MYFKHPATGEGFDYELIKKPRVKNISLKVNKDGSVKVTVPRGGFRTPSIDFIENILEERFHFVLQSQRRYRLLAKKYPDLFNFSEEHYRRYRKQAQELIKSKVDYYCRRQNFQYNKLSIRNQKTRWGSCSRDGNLNFSYKLIFLTPEEQDYIVVHELCHLKEQNHSKDFWSLVKEILPEYENAHKSIRSKS